MKLASVSLSFLERITTRNECVGLNRPTSYGMGVKPGCVSVRSMQLLSEPARNTTLE